MCGIVGYIHFEKSLEDRRPILKRMCDLIVHRGPDDSGLYLEGGVALGHRRLSIIDLGGGKQPMQTEDGKLCVVFNGEIYNYPELKRELEAKGHVFRTHSDTEVLLHGYREYGTGLLPKLNGMFVFALWDVDRKRLFAARDRLGKKPFYFHHGADKFIFASEMKSILAEPEVSRDLDFGAVNKFFSYGYIPAPDSIFSGIRKLRPGHFLVLENRRLNIEQYWDVRYTPNRECKTEDDYVDKLQDLLDGAVKRRLLSDVPLGAFLSGGLDSSVVVGTMAKVTGNPVETFTIGFQEAEFSEFADARVVSQAFGTHHHEFTVQPDAMGLMEKLVWHFDEPFGDSSALPTYYVSQMARRGVTVVLSGDGGDEIFAGYNHYNWYQDFRKYVGIPRALRHGLLAPIGRMLPIQAKAKNLLIGMGLAEEIARYDFVEIFPLIKDNLFSPWLKDQVAGVGPGGLVLDNRRYWAQAPAEPFISRMQYLDTKVYLPEDILMKVDRMSMANSLETRAPLLDYEVVEFAATVPPEFLVRDGKGKHLLRRVAGRLLPKDILAKKKQGFAIPREKWFRGDLKEYARDLLTSEKFRGRGYFKQSVVENMLAQHARGAKDYSYWIWCLINFELWHRTFLDRETRKV